MTIQIESLSKRYARAQAETAALSDLSLTVAAGEAVALLGPNGAGKSTAIKILSTLIRPDSGRATVAGFDLATEAPRVREVIGIALQDVGLYPSGRVRQILMLHARLFGLSRAGASRRSDELLELSGLERVAGQRVHRLSGGMRRRLDLSLALINRPRVLLLDEPTGSLDPFSRGEFWRELGNLRDAGTSILFASQSLEEAEHLADRVAVLVKGILEQDNAPATAVREMWSGDGVGAAR